MMGRQTVDQSQLFYLFNLKNTFQRIISYAGSIQSSRGCWSIFARSWHRFYSDIGRPSIDPELMIRMLIVGYCYGIRFERRLCEEVKLPLGYRWFCRLELGAKVPD